MKRSLAFWCAPLLLAGCHSTPQAVDPFLPSARVPPPGTGAAAGAAAPYYTAPAASAPAAGAPYTPPGNSYDYTSPAAVPTGTPYQGQGNPQPVDRWPMTNRNSTNRQSSTLPPSDAKPGAVRSRLAAAAPASRDEKAAASVQTAVADDSEGQVVQASHVKTVKVIRSQTEQDDEAASVAASDEQEPRRLPQADDAIDIMDLPPADNASSKARRAQRIAASSGKIIRASHAEPALSQRAPVEPFAAQRYAYTPGYRKLNGQLEYSLVDRRWKLRYIPIDGGTDSHGGSVVLVGELPDEFHAGDFVTVTGRLAGDAAPGEFAPAYEFDRIEPLAD